MNNEVLDVLSRLTVDLDRVYADLETKEQQDMLRAAMIRLVKLKQMVASDDE
jgi:hypothetical protein